MPTDIGNSEARYLRDVEMYYLLKAMVDKGLEVTVVLDSCHSGGATRGLGGAATRGIASIDTTPRPTVSLVAPAAELLADLAGRRRDDQGDEAGQRLAARTPGLYLARRLPGQ